MWSWLHSPNGGMRQILDLVTFGEFIHTVGGVHTFSSTEIYSVHSHLLSHLYSVSPWCVQCAPHLFQNPNEIPHFFLSCNSNFCKINFLAFSMAFWWCLITMKKSKNKSLLLFHFPSLRCWSLLKQCQHKCKSFFHVAKDVIFLQSWIGPKYFLPMLSHCWKHFISFSAPVESQVV